MNLQFIFILCFILAFWNIILTVFFLRFFFYYQRITKGNKKESLLKMLDQIVSDQERMKKALDELVAACVKLEAGGLLHIQKVGLLRFNPFKDTGGDQSFILALVDAKGTGVIISSLHTRSGTRWYAKHVTNGKGSEYELSKEEEEALKTAKTL
jgi:hypothetical protein